MFLHGGWMHLGGNMLYLWIFGDNLERAMGHGRFLVFYLVCGIAAGVRAHRLQPARPTCPALGASGAISGVLGGYLLLFPHNRVRVLTRGGIIRYPAIVVLGFWIVIQLFSGIGSMAQTQRNGRRRGLHGAHRRLRRRTRAGEARHGRPAGARVKGHAPFRERRAR